MILDKNPLTKDLHDDWRRRICKEFSDVDFSDSPDYLCLIKYIDSSPQKFYSKIAFKTYLQKLEKIKNSDPKLLADILNSIESLLSISNRVLNEVNEKQIHDILLPNNDLELINFIDSEIHYNLLKVYETPFFQLCYILSEYYWIKENKGTDGLDLFNATEQLKKVGFEFIKPAYLHDVRNGIAHGKIVYSDNDILYFDKKNKKTSISTKEIIRAFDKTLDITNGFFLAFKVFCFTNSDYFESSSISIPKSILLEELQAKSNAPAWTITNCFESIALENKKQLMIYVKNDNWEFSKASINCFMTAYWAEKLTKSYDRFFFTLYSKYSKSTPIGWAAYDGIKLRMLREKNENNINEYNGVLENDLFYFIPKFKFPKLIYKLGTYTSIFKVIFPIMWRDYRNSFFPKYFDIRVSQIHSNGRFSIIKDPSIILKYNSVGEIEPLLRSIKKKIIRKTIKYSRKQLSVFSLTRYLTVKYIRVFVYDTDKRKRDLLNAGLPPELIATIEVNTSKKIKTIDIFGGTAEQNGKYRIVWNEKWIKKKGLPLTPPSTR